MYSGLHCMSHTFGNDQSKIMIPTVVPKDISIKDAISKLIRWDVVAKVVPYALPLSIICRTLGADPCWRRPPRVPALKLGEPGCLVRTCWNCLRIRGCHMRGYHLEQHVTPLSEHTRSFPYQHHSTSPLDQSLSSTKIEIPVEWRCQTQSLNFFSVPRFDCFFSGCNLAYHLRHRTNTYVTPT